MKKISLTLIVKNEEKVLKRCIKSMSGAYDELIIVDTGSTDRTIEIAEKLGARVQHFKWVDDFAAARNYALSFATGDWIMWCDADDIMHNEDVKRFREIVHSHDNDDIMGINFPYIYSHESTGTGEIPNFKYHRLRIMKKESNPIWKGRIHEYNQIQGRTINCDEVNFHHYRDEGKGTHNTARNLRILKKVVDDCNDQEKPRYLFYYGKELIYNNKLDEAIETFKQYIPLSNWIPEKHRAMFEMAVCYQVKGDITNARKYALEAIHLDEDFVDPYILLGKIAYNNKEWNKVIKWMTAAIHCEAPKIKFFDFIPYHTYVPYDFMAIAYWNLGEYQKGLDCVLKCLEYKPKDERYLHNKKEFENKC
jgi:glycosyltransferase involved in cell wall biosynthesis